MYRKLLLSILLGCGTDSRPPVVVRPPVIPPTVPVPVPVPQPPVFRIDTIRIDTHTQIVIYPSCIYGPQQWCPQKASDSLWILMYIRSRANSIRDTIYTVERK